MSDVIQFPTEQGKRQQWRWAVPRVAAEKAVKELELRTFRLKDQQLQMLPLTNVTLAFLF